MTLWLLVLLSAVLPSRPATGLTWHFDQAGDPQGWTARESGFSLAPESPPLRSEVRDGIWRIQPRPFTPGHNPAIELISPRPGHDSALFDRLVLRLRLVHTRPIEGLVAFGWVSSRFPVDDTGQVRIPLYLPQVYTTEWQQISFTELRSGESRYSFLGVHPQLVWEGELVEMRLHLLLAGGMLRRNVVIESQEDVPEAVEIDWIVLTGVEEQAQGELSPPAVADLAFGTLFEAARFHTLEVEGLDGLFCCLSSALGDLDGDGDLDMAAVFDRQRPPRLRGWVMAFNNGKGEFEESQIRLLDVLEDVGWMPFLDGADVNGDGRMDLLVAAGSRQAYVLINDKEEGWVVAATFEEALPLGLADVEGDGDMDVWAAPLEGPVRILLNDGTGDFSEDLLMAPTSPRVLSFREGHAAMQFTSLRLSRRILWRPPFENPALGYDVTSVDSNGDVIEKHLATDVAPWLIRYSGDVNADGGVDLLVSDASEGRLSFTRFQGLSFLLNQGDGDFQRLSWKKDVRTSDREARFLDLDADGVLDLVLVESSDRGAAVIVALGAVDGGLPIQEGRYPLEGQGSTILPGDVDGDGDIDLVVLAPSSVEGSGVHVLLNQLSERATAIAESSGASLPLTFHLGASYPNPFNLQTFVNILLPVSRTHVRLQVYNVLGQPVRTLVEGRLAAGRHRVAWDGRDGRGRNLPSGVYVYRLQAGEWSVAGKVVKAE